MHPRTLLASWAHGHTAGSRTGVRQDLHVLLHRLLSSSSASSLNWYMGLFLGHLPLLNFTPPLLLCNPELDINRSLPNTTSNIWAKGILLVRCNMDVSQSLYKHDTINEEIHTFTLRLQKKSFKERIFFFLDISSDSTELMVTSILMISTLKGKAKTLKIAHPERERESRGGSAPSPLAILSFCQTFDSAENCHLLACTTCCEMLTGVSFLGHGNCLTPLACLISLNKTSLLLDLPAALLIAHQQGTGSFYADAFKALAVTPAPGCTSSSQQVAPRHCLHSKSS